MDHWSEPSSAPHQTKYSCLSPLDSATRLDFPQVAKLLLLHRSCIAGTPVDVALASRLRRRDSKAAQVKTSGVNSMVSRALWGGVATISSPSISGSTYIAKINLNIFDRRPIIHPKHSSSFITVYIVVSKCSKMYCWSSKLQVRDLKAWVKPCFGGLMVYPKILQPHLEPRQQNWVTTHGFHSLPRIGWPGSLQGRWPAAQDIHEELWTIEESCLSITV